MADLSGCKRDAGNREQLLDGEVATEVQKSKRPKEMRLSEKEAAARKRYLVFIEYNGNDFSGSQRQKQGVRTVQDACEKALENMTKQFQTFYFSSRTDSGVHALANSAHVTVIRRHRKSGEPVAEPYECSAIQAAMNHRLRQQDYYCRVTHIKEVPLNMHARHNATGRTYVYRITCPTALHTLSVFEFNRTWAYDGRLDTYAMGEAAAQLVGKHDFSTFRALGCSAKSPVKTILSFQVSEHTACPEWAPASNTASLSSVRHKAVVIRVHARSFLYHQVRLMVAWLVEVGAGRRSAAETTDVLEKRSIDALKFQMAPPWGLYLAEVHYDDQQEPLQPNEDALSSGDGSEEEGCE